LTDADRIELSVVVPAYDAQRTLAACVASLLAQRVDQPFEVIVVASADHAAELPRLDPDPRLTVVALTPRRSAAEARNVGAARARGRLIAFTDADVTVPADWLAHLRACASGGACVGGSVRNGTPESRPGTAEYLVEFADLHPARREPSAHGATCNLMVPRTIWERYGPFPEDLGGCEDTLLTEGLRHAGLFVYARHAAVVHQNRRQLRSVLAHQFALGAAHARLDRRRGQMPRKPAISAARRSIGRFVYLHRKLGEWAPSERGRALRLTPLVALGFGSWGLGLWREARRGDG
jgi:glycosyltransferase involved in cell wall biosynthesis